MGLLFAYGYCGASECFYCPSHHGNHPFERYADQWTRKQSTGVIYTNYHYAGHRDWRSDRLRNLLDNDLVLATDGLRTTRDFNHNTGMNVLKGDISVRWRDDVNQLYQALPHNEVDPPGPQYLGLWDVVGNND